MADYIYLLETRLSAAQQRAISSIRTIARDHDVTVFLTGGAVRDLTGGASVRDLDLTVQGDALKLKKALEDSGAQIVGENTSSQQLFLLFPGGVRVELASAMSVTYPKPGKPRYEPGSLTDDLRRRDFTANAMAISLNEGSYGLLMDPLNGVADIENRELRLVSNYGFIEDPSRLIRAARLMARLGWQMEERSRQRYETAKEENYIEAMGPWHRGYEAEEIFHEEDPVRILRALEAEGWIVAIFAPLTAAKANTAALADLAERQGALQVQGVLAQAAAIAFPLVTAKLTPAEVSTLKGMFVRPGFVREIESLETRTREFAARLSSKEAAAPSAAWKLLHSSEPNLVLAVSYGSRGGAVQTRLKTFLTDSPSARQRIPYALMQEMRITPDLPEYQELIDKLFFELMDGRLSTPEEMKAFLEPYSPPAPPPPVNLRRARAKKEARPSRAKARKQTEADETVPTVAAEEELVGVAEGLMEPGTLTGPDRGPEPTPQVPLEGKVAPLATSAATKAARVAPAKVSSEKKESAPEKPAAATKPAPAAVKSTSAAGKPGAPTKPAKTAAPPVAKKTAVAPGKPSAAEKKPAPLPAKKASAGGKSSSAKAPARQSGKAAAKQLPPAKKQASAKASSARGTSAAGQPTARTSPSKSSSTKKSVVSREPVSQKKAAPGKAAAAKQPARKAVQAKKAVAKKSGRR